MNIICVLPLDMLKSTNMYVPNIDGIERIQKRADSTSGKNRRVTNCMKTLKCGSADNVGRSGKSQSDRNPPRHRRMYPHQIRPEPSLKKLFLHPNASNSRTIQKAHCLWSRTHTCAWSVFNSSSGLQTYHSRCLRGSQV